MKHLLIVVAKLPTCGYSKSRLRKSIGDSTDTFCKAMLYDILHKFSKNLDQIVTQIGKTILGFYFSPGENIKEAEELLMSFDQLKYWSLYPMLSNNNDLTSSDLSSKLSHALIEIAQRENFNTVTFIGSDCPTIEVDEFILGAKYSYSGKAYITPSSDGGYVLLSLPTESNAGIFKDVIWSSSSTFDSQISAIESYGIECIRGEKTYIDIDEIADLESLYLEISCSNKDHKNYYLRTFLEMKQLFSEK